MASPQVPAQFRCSACGAGFPSLQALGGHKSAHSPKRRQKRNTPDTAGAAPSAPAPAPAPGWFSSPIAKRARKPPPPHPNSSASLLSSSPLLSASTNCDPPRPSGVPPPRQSSTSQDSVSAFQQLPRPQAAEGPSLADCSHELSSAALGLTAFPAPFASCRSSKLDPLFLHSGLGSPFLATCMQPTPFFGTQGFVPWGFGAYLPGMAGTIPLPELAVLSPATHASPGLELPAAPMMRVGPSLASYIHPCLGAPFPHTGFAAAADPASSSAALLEQVAAAMEPDQEAPLTRPSPDGTLDSADFARHLLNEAARKIRQLGSQDTHTSSPSCPSLLADSDGSTKSPPWEGRPSATAGAAQNTAVAKNPLGPSFSFQGRAEQLPRTRSPVSEQTSPHTSVPSAGPLPEPHITSQEAYFQLYRASEKTMEFPSPELSQDVLRMGSVVRSAWKPCSRDDTAMDAISLWDAKPEESGERPASSTWMFNANPAIEAMQELPKAESFLDLTLRL